MRILWSSSESVILRICGRLGSVGDIDLSEDVADVPVHGVSRYHQLVGYLLVALAGGGKAEYFDFACGKMSLHGRIYFRYALTLEEFDHCGCGGRNLILTRQASDLASIVEQHEPRIRDKPHNSSPESLGSRRHR